MTEQLSMAQVALVIRNPPANARDIRDSGSIPGSGRSPGEGNGNPLQYSCPVNPIERSLVGYSPWGCKESDTTMLLSMHEHTCINSLDPKKQGSLTSRI